VKTSPKDHPLSRRRKPEKKQGCLPSKSPGSPLHIVFDRPSWACQENRKPLTRRARNLRRRAHKECFGFVGTEESTADLPGTPGLVLQTGYAVGLKSPGRPHSASPECYCPPPPGLSDKVPFIGRVALAINGKRSGASISRRSQSFLKTQKFCDGLRGKFWSSKGSASWSKFPKKKTSGVVPVHRVLSRGDVGRPRGSGPKHSGRPLALNRRGRCQRTENQLRLTIKLVDSRQKHCCSLKFEYHPITERCMGLSRVNRMGVRHGGQVRELLDVTLKSAKKRSWGRGGGTTVPGALRVLNASSRVNRKRY